MKVFAKLFAGISCKWLASNEMDIYVFAHGVCGAPCQVCAKGIKLMCVCTRCLELFLALGWCQGNERDICGYCLYICVWN